MFGVTPELRDAAATLLKLLPEADPDEERNSGWLDIQQMVLEDLTMSPAGQQTLLMLESQPKAQPGASEKTEDRLMDAGPQLSATNAQVAIPERPAPEPDDTNEYMRRLAWPPKASPLHPPPENAEPPDWIRHLDRPQVIPWIDESSNSPLE